MYDLEIKNAVLDTLENRVSGIADCIQMLFNEGYIPNKNKITILDWSSILFNAYENIDLFTEQQQINLDNICNKILKL